MFIQLNCIQILEEVEFDFSLVEDITEQAL